MAYYQPLVQNHPARPRSAHILAGGPLWFTHCLKHSRTAAPEITDADDIPGTTLQSLTAPRGTILGLSMDRPKIMGVLNTTPDSFSDGGMHNTFDAAVHRGQEMHQQGADVIDIGGESTRPGADFVDRIEERNRIEPVVKALSKIAPISIDTRKADVARAALDGGAGMFNDVTALSYDPRSLSLVGTSQPDVCLMHASGDPKTMQDNPRYDNVLLDVYDYLAARVQACVDAGLSKSKITIDPGIGFGKTLEHNMLLIRGLSLFHGLGCPILLGVSRKRFIGTLGQAQDPADRLGGSLAVGLEGLAQGAQILRVHDVFETAQALRLWQAMTDAKTTMGT
ncbi:dihydropteroate synthase [Amylibacter marinus]|uniref:Dihydropteroate synthase n=1 Tax=Amylibacter marinus TaxID=1475483 RepID=A0ABQ5VTG9_9RHOB|nr:dihydropteroate synthase [Amylibacter marinus]GLQ34571.1 dihydropteroate synthase [Amylibacter marinus]